MIPLCVVDAFTERPFAGNPAAVCVLDRWPSNEWLQLVAREMNLSETAFLVRRQGNEFELRWFTPRVEVELCGHATLASAHALWESGRATRDVITFATRKSGSLSAAPLPTGEIQLDFPAKPATLADAPAGLLETLGAKAVAVGRNEFDYLVQVAIDGASSIVNTIIGGIQKPFGAGYEKGVVVAVGDVDGDGKAEVAVTRGGPVASPNPAVQKIKMKVLQLRGVNLTELPLSADGSTAFAPFGGLSGAANTIKRDGRVTFVDQDGDGKDEVVFTALDPLTNPANGQVRVAVFSVNTTATAGAATVVSTGPDAGTYRTGTGVVDHAIAHAPDTGAAEDLALVTESASSGLVYLAPLTGQVRAGGFALPVLHGGITLDGI